MINPRSTGKHIRAADLVISGAQKAMSSQVLFTENQRRQRSGDQSFQLSMNLTDGLKAVCRILCHHLHDDFGQARWNLGPG